MYEINTARNPLTANERTRYRTKWAKGPKCTGCSQPLLLTQPGRDKCQKCAPTDWATFTGTAG